MSLSIIISRFSNLLFFAQQANKYNLQKYFINEHTNTLFYGKNKNEIWKQIRKSIGEQNTKQLKKVIVPVRYPKIQTPFLRV
ncbi:MAG: hypothetical protein AB1643_02725 [Patescibacteria group bacterium]